MEQFLAWVIMLGVPASIVAAIVWPYVARRRFRTALANDVDLMLVSRDPLSVRSRRAPVLELRAFTGKRSADTWQMSCHTDLHLDLDVTRELDRSFFDTIGDFLVGDQAFDDTFHLHGTDIDALQQLFGHVEVRDAVRAVVSDDDITRMTVNDAGLLRVSTPYHLDVERLRAVHAKLRRLVSTLETHAPPPSTGPIEHRRIEDGVPAIASSGAPVAFKPYKPI